MKKYTLFSSILILSLIFIGSFSFTKSARADYLPGCGTSERGVSSTTGNPCNLYFTVGCASERGYSSTTGEKCYSMMLPPGCIASDSYSLTTGVKCDSWFSNSSLPIGCTSTQGYSPVTGMKCDSPFSSTFPPGCARASGYSVTTGMYCGTASNFPPGCTSTSGYSPTTGARCNGPVDYIPPVYRYGCTSYSGYSSTTGQACDGSTQITYNQPSITSISPTSISPGGSFNVYGQGLANVSSIFVDGSEVMNSYHTNYSSTNVLITFPSSIASGSHQLQLRDSSGFKSNTVNFNVIAQPVTITNYHSADTNKDGRIILSEVVAFGATFGNIPAYKVANTIYKRGEFYGWNNSGIYEWKDASGHVITESDIATANSTTNPTITPGSQTVASGQNAIVNFTFPSNTIKAILYFACPNGVSTRTFPEICNTDIPVTSNANWSPLFYNTTGSLQNVVVNYYVYTSNNPNYAVGVSSQITVNPTTFNSDH